MRDSRRHQPLHSDRPESLDKSVEHDNPNAYQGGFPGQNAVPMQPAMYHYMTQQQHMANMAQMQASFPMGPQMGEGPYNRMPLSGTMNGSMGPSPIQGATKHGAAPGMIPVSQFETVDQSPYVPSHYSRPLPNQAYGALDGSGKPLGSRSVTPGSKSGTPADGRMAGFSGYSGQYPTEFHNQMYMGSAISSPYTSTGGANDENMGKRKASREDDTSSGKKVPVTTQPMTAQGPMISALRLQHLRIHQSEQALLRIHGLVDALNLSGPMMQDLTYWRKFSDQYFTPRASIRHTKKLGSDYRLFEISMSMLPMMWVSLSALDVQRIEVSMSQVKAEVLSNGCILFYTPALVFSYHYSDGSYITHHSHLKGSFNPSFKIQWLDIFVFKFSPGIEWSGLEKILARPNVALKNMLRPAGASGLDRENKNEGSGNRERDSYGDFSELRSNVTAFRNISGQGLHEGILRIFQVSDVMSALTDLCVYQKAHNIKSPLEALDSFVKQNKDVDTPNPAATNINGLQTADNGSVAKGKNSAGKEDQMSVGNSSAACSPQDMKGKSVVNENGPQLKRRRSNKAASRASKGSSSSTPTSENFDCNGIPGTKRIKF